MASTRGRSVVVPMTNKSGGSVAAGDVVIIDTGNDTAFTTTTSARSEVSLGVAQETIANNASGRVLTHGYAALINVPASVTRGHYIETHTVAKQATGNSSRRSGSFGQFLTGGTSPTGWIWGRPDQTASGSGSGQGLVDFGFVRYTGGDISASADNTYQDLGISDITLTAATGDIIEVGFSATANNSTAVVLSFDCVTIVSASPVNSIASGAAQSNSNFGAQCWLIAGGGSGKAAGSIMYTLQSGDITGGTVVLRMRVFIHSATNRTIDGTTARPIHFWAKNLGAAL